MARDDEGRILVLGGSGFLGAHLVGAALEARRGQVLAVSRSGRLHGPAAEGAESLRIDLSAAEALRSLFDRAAPALVLNAAAASRALDCERDPELARRLNVELPAQLAELCAAEGRRLVHVSTDQVFGRRPAPAGGFREEDPPAPLGVYGESKMSGEAAVLERDQRALVVRLPLLYGESFGRGLGASDALIAQLARGERPALFVDEWRTPLAVEEAARALLELALGSHVGLLHLAGRERVSRMELGLAVLASRGMAADAVRALSRADYQGPTRAADTSLNATRARAVLRTPLRGIEAGLMATRRPE